jgi:hypothetical protein
MTQYLLSVHSVEGEVGNPMTEEEMQQSWKQIQVLNEEMKSTGAWVSAGRLHEPGTATVVSMSGGQRTFPPSMEPAVRRTFTPSMEPAVRRSVHRRATQEAGPVRFYRKRPDHKSPKGFSRLRRAEVMRRPRRAVPPLTSSQSGRGSLAEQRGKLRGSGSV